MLGVSFFDLGGGLGSVLSVIACFVLAILLKYNHEHLRDGTLSYNALMVGTAIGYSFDWNASIFLLILVSSTLTFLITVWYFVQLGAKKLPMLSAPFLAGLWIVLLGAPNFSALQLNPKTAYSLFNVWPELFTETTAFISQLDAANYLHLLFRSSGAIFFQFNDLAGVIILIGLIIQSRIAFLLTIYSFSIGYAFYSGMEGNFSQLIYSYIGFNFILTGIALGGFFIVPSWRSFLLVGLVIPVNGLLISALHPVFQLIGLPLFSLPFNLIVLLTLMVVWQRYYPGGLVPVVWQEYSAEKHLYKHLGNLNRYRKQTSIYLSLPVMGLWRVSQAFFGKHTHKEVYAYAFDFDVVDETGATFQGNGTKVEEYYCYNLPVIAPAAGYITDIRDGIDDNEVSDVNLSQNWGNSIVIKHTEGLYTQLSHLKKESLQVQLGEYVVKGQILARCGSSGRSPEPHLHYQVQTLPYVGSPTLAYPFSYYQKRLTTGNQLHCFNFPKENELVENVKVSSLLSESFYMIPGKRLQAKSQKGLIETWSAHTNYLNQTYIFSEESGAVAYFVNDGVQFYFTEFYGSKKSLLYTFYLAAYKLVLSDDNTLHINDEMMPDGHLPLPIKFILDFIAPFYRPFKVTYESNISFIDRSHDASEIRIDSTILVHVARKKISQKNYRIVLKKGQWPQILVFKDSKIAQQIQCYEV